MVRSLSRSRITPGLIALLIFGLLLTSFPPFSPAYAATFNSVGDSDVRSGAPNQNFGSAVIMDVVDVRDGLVRFDLSSIPAGSTITSATLALVVTAINGSNPRNYSVHRVLVDWNESTVTWNNPGSTADTHFASSPTATVNLSAVGTYYWNVTADVASFVGGSATNYGWRIRWTSNDSGTSKQIDVGAKENATPSNRPVLSVTYTAPDTTPPVISNIQSSEISQTTATITWTTNEPATSQVEYGTTTSYGSSTSLDSSLVTYHSVTIYGLTGNTLYHYRVKSKDANNNLATSGDATFTTNEVPLPPADVAKSLPGTRRIAAPAIPEDKTPPVVSLNPPSPNPTKATTAAFAGRAVEETGIVSALQFSLNGGKSWHPIKQMQGLGTKEASFTFTTPALEDGNYDVVVRAFDNTENIGLSPVQVLVVDVLPPIVGGHLVTLGPQVLTPDKEGFVSAVVGSEQRIILSAVGGPTKVEVLLAPTPSGRGSDQSVGGEEAFPLEFSADVRLWSGKVKFSELGTHDLYVTAEDGAGNKTERFLGGVLVEPGGEVLDKETGKPIENAEVYLYLFEKTTGRWVLWNAAAFGLENPYLTDRKGQYSFFVPPGKYYLSVSAPGYRTVASEIVELERGSLLGFVIRLPLRPYIKIPFFEITIYLPSFLDLLVSPREEVASPLVTVREPKILKVGDNLPTFSLSDLEGRRVSAEDLKGKSFLTFGSVWSPTFSEQAPILSALAKEGTSFYVIFLQEKASAVETFLKRGGYSFPALIDGTGALAESYKVITLPQHFFIEEGVIRGVEGGVLGEERFLEFFR